VRQHSSTYLTPDMRCTACDLAAACALVLLKCACVGAWTCSVEVTGSFTDINAFSKSSLRCLPGALENGNLTVVLHPALQELSFSGHTLPPADATLGSACFLLPRHMRHEPVVEPSCLAETYPAAADLLCRCSYRSATAQVKWSRQSGLCRHRSSLQRPGQSCLDCFSARC